MIWFLLIGTACVGIAAWLLLERDSDSRCLWQQMPGAESYSIPERSSWTRQMLQVHGAKSLIVAVVLSGLLIAVLMAALIVVVAYVLHFGPEAVRGWVRDWRELISALAVVGAVGLLGVSARGIRRSYLRGRLFAALTGVDCGGCGYGLGSLPRIDGRVTCPECGLMRYYPPPGAADRP